MQMQVSRALGFVALLAGCASAGGRHPEVSDPEQPIAEAEAQVDEAVQAGADSLAPAALASARQHLDAARAALAQPIDRTKTQVARAEILRRNRSLAAVEARAAAADAVYAKAETDRVKAERERMRAQTLLEAVSRPGGTQ